MLFLAFPRSDYDDADGAIATYVAVLEDYSDAIVAFVTNPKTGIQRRNKFAPRVAELVAACDEAAERIERHNRYTNWGRGNQRALEGPKEAKPTLDELKAKYGPNYGLGPAKGDILAASADPAPSWDRIAESYRSDPERIKALTETEFMSRK